MNEETAAPALVDSTTYGLDNPLKNKKLLASLKKKPSLVIGILSSRSDEHLELHRTGKEEGFIYAEYKEEIGVFIQYHTYHYSFLPVKSITQTKLWRNKKLPVSNDFSPSLFFRIILKQTGAVLSDKDHTDDGVEFWKRRTAEALHKGMHVALVNFGSKSYEEITSPKLLEEKLDEVWGGGLQKQQYQQLRWLIWK